MLVCLAYLSSATAPFDMASLSAVVEQAARNNAGQQITGMLCYYDQNFLQFLEGEATRIEETFARIKADPRHGGVIELYREPIGQRLFPDWTMALLPIDKLTGEQQAICRDLPRVRLADGEGTDARQAMAIFLDTFRLSLP